MFFAGHLVCIFDRAKKSKPQPNPTNNYTPLLPTLTTPVTYLASTLPVADAPAHDATTLRHDVPLRSPCHRRRSTLSLSVNSPLHDSSCFRGLGQLLSCYLQHPVTHLCHNLSCMLTKLGVFFARLLVCIFERAKKSQPQPNPTNNYTPLPPTRITPVTYPAATLPVVDAPVHDSRPTPLPRKKKLDRDHPKAKLRDPPTITLKPPGHEDHPASRLFRL